MLLAQMVLPGLLVPQVLRDWLVLPVLLALPAQRAQTALPVLPEPLVPLVLPELQERMEIPALPAIRVPPAQRDLPVQHLPRQMQDIR